MNTTTVKVAAITGQLDWSLRQTCSGDRFDRDVATAYIQSVTARQFQLLEQAIDQGAVVVLAPEYFTGCEMCLSTPENQRTLIEPPDGPTAQALVALASRRQVTLAAAYSMAHGQHVAQTGIIARPDGHPPVLHVKHNRGLPNPLPETLDVHDVGFARVGMLVCSDCQDPLNMRAMTAARMNLLLIPGCGFFGDHYREITIARAIDQHCPIIYADDGRAMIVDHTGAVLAETHDRGAMVIADLPIPEKTVGERYWDYYNT